MGLDALSDHVDRLDVVAALIDDAETKVALKSRILHRSIRS